MGCGGHAPTSFMTSLGLYLPSVYLMLHDITKGPTLYLHTESDQIVKVVMVWEQDNTSSWMKTECGCGDY